MQVTGSQVIINLIHMFCLIKKNAFDQMTKYLIVQEIRLNVCNHEIRLICMSAFAIY